MTQPYYQPDYYSHQTAANPRPAAVTAAAIIGIVIASLGLLCHGGGLIGALWQALGPRVAGQPELPAWVNATSAVLAVVFLVLAILWMVVSIGLLRMSGWARTLGVRLAVVHLLLLIVEVAVLLIFIAPVTKDTVASAMANQPGGATNPVNTAGFQRGMAMGAAYGGPVIGFLVGLILPLTMVTILTRPTTKAAFEGAAAPPQPPTYPPPPAPSPAQ